MKPIALFLWTCTLLQAGSTRLGPCRVFPPDHIWNVPVDTLPLHPQSRQFVASIGGERPLHPDFGSRPWKGGFPGIPYTIAQPGAPKIKVSLQSPESDPGPYVIPDYAAIEGEGGLPGGDRHVLVVDPSDCHLYELFAARREPRGGWSASSGAIFSLNSYSLRPAGWTSADAAGLPILPGLVRYEEVAAGEIAHALRFTAPHTRRAFVWPARHFASRLADPSFPPMGQRFRLRAGYPLDTFPPQARIILQGLKRYGMMLADNGGPWYLTGVAHPGWDDGQILSLKRVRGSDFEAVDVSGLMIDPGSGRARSNMAR